MIRWAFDIVPDMIKRREEKFMAKVKQIRIIYNGAEAANRKNAGKGQS